MNADTAAFRNHFSQIDIPQSSAETFREINDGETSAIFWD